MRRRFQQQRDDGGGQASDAGNDEGDQPSIQLGRMARPAENRSQLRSDGVDE